MDGLDLAAGTYRSPERRPSLFARCFPSLRHYASFLPIVYRAARLAKRGAYDDALDAFGIHGVGGALGAILTGVFAAAVWGGTDGLIHGNAHLFIENIIGVLAAAAYSVAVTLGLLKIIDATIGLRVSSDEESEGLDTNLHGEEGYHMGGAGALPE